MKVFGVGWQPRCPACGSDTPKPDKPEEGIYTCGTCGMIHYRDASGRLVEAER